MIFIWFLSSEKRLILELCHRVDGDKVCWVPTTKKVKSLYLAVFLGFNQVYFFQIYAHHQEGTIFSFPLSSVFFPSMSIVFL